MLEPKTYRKKPVHVEAIEFNGNNSKQVEKFVYGESHEKYFTISPHIMIRTWEGTMKAETGNYIVKDYTGDIYLRTKAAFNATHEEVDQDGQRVNSTQYPTSPKTAMMTVAAVLEWLEGEKEDIESDRKKIKNKYPKQLAKKIDDQLGASITTIETLIEKLTKSTFEQMDEAYGNE